MRNRVTALLGVLLDRQVRGGIYRQVERSIVGRGSRYAFYTVGYMHSFGGVWNRSVLVRPGGPSGRSWSASVGCESNPETVHVDGDWLCMESGWGLNALAFLVLFWLGNHQNSFTASIHGELIALSRATGPPLSGVISNLNFLLEYLLPVLIGHLVGRLRLKSRVRRSDVGREGSRPGHVSARSYCRPMQPKLAWWRLATPLGRRHPPETGLRALTSTSGHCKPTTQTCSRYDCRFGIDLGRYSSIPTRHKRVVGRPRQNCTTLFQ